jgi:hypothetical protein
MCQTWAASCGSPQNCLPVALAWGCLLAVGGDFQESCSLYQWQPLGAMCAFVACLGYKIVK